MKQLFIINETTENKISYYYLLFFMLSLPFERFYSTLMLVGFALHTVIFFNRQRLKNINISIFIFSAVFFISFLSLFYSHYPREGRTVLTRQIAILLFPLLFAVTFLDIAAYRTRLLSVFAIGCTLTVVYLFYDAVHIILFQHLPLKDLLSPVFVNQGFSAPIEMHATYLSMLLVIAIVFLLQQLFSEAKKSGKIIYIFCCAVMTAGLLQLGSKSVLIAFIVIINIGLSFFLVQKHRRLRFLVFSGLSTLLVISIIVSVPSFKTRYWTAFEEDLYTINRTGRDYSRAERWEVALNIAKGSPVIGYGAGAEMPLLKNAYFEHKMYGPYLDALNSHNQYIGFVLTAGFAGLLVYLATLYYGLRRSVKSKDILLFSFTILILLVSFSENIFEVNKGIFFYAFFFSFLTATGRPKSV